MIISLTGFMGCGKSSVGRRLSTLLSCSYTDLDAVIEKEAGRSIPEIFAADGEGAFRALEAECLQRFISSQQDRGLEQSLPSQVMAARCKSPLGCLPIARDLCGQRGSTVPAPYPAGTKVAILALGGGTVMTPECAEMVHKNTVCIYLRASVETLVSHLKGETQGRPMLESGASLRERICELMERRSSTYEKTAHIIIDTDGKGGDEICHEILESLRN